MCHVMKNLYYVICEQESHPRSLISAFVVRCLDIITLKVSTSEIARLLMASVAKHAGSSPI